MLKLSLLLALFICFVYSNKEQNETVLLKGKPELKIKQNEDYKPAFQTFKGHYVEETQNSKPCKKNKSRRFGDKNNEDLDLLESIPLRATVEQTNTASIDNKVITSSLHGANYNYQDKNTDMATDNSALQSKNCDCEHCLVEANKKVLHFESMALDRAKKPFSNVAIDDKNAEPELADNNKTPFNKVNLDTSVSGDINNIPLNIITDEDAGPCNKKNQNTRRSKCRKIDSLENISTGPSTRRILPGIIENPSYQESEANKLYQDSPQLNPNDDADIETRHNLFPNVQKVSNSYDIDLVHNMNINESPQEIPPLEDSVESQLMEPTRGKGIYDMKDTGVMLLENSRVCYACSTMSDPTCWSPNRRTTVKYCRKGHQSCLTKSFKHKGQSVIIRDCGSHCVTAPLGEEKYSSCSICHSDLCNGASPMSIYTTGFAIIIFSGIYLNTY